MAGLESIKQNHSPSESAPRVKAETVASSLKDDVAAGRSYPTTRMQEALAAFDADVKTPPAPDSHAVISTLLRNAIILVENREYVLAMNLLRCVLMRKPNEARAMRLLGQCLRESGRYEEALTCFKGLVAASGDDEALSLYAETLYLLGRDAEAARIYADLLSRLTESSPALFDIYKNMGNIHVRAGDFEAAEELYNKANTLRADSDILMVNYGTLEIQRENFSEAVERFRRAVELNQGNDRGWVGLAMVHRQMGDFDLARANIERALDINPRNKTALHVLCEWNSIDRDFGPAVRRLTDYLALEGEDAEMGFLLARILIHLNRLDEAQLEMERVLALEPAIEGGVQVMGSLQQEIRRRSECA